jgi:uncharacterized protein (DUF58 family)
MLNLFRNAEDAAAGWPGLLAQAQASVAGLQAGDHRQKKPGMGERFWQFRDYNPSDRPQDIDWRQSAKGDSVFVREKERQMPRSFSFWCDDNPGMDFTSDFTRDTKRRAAQTICLATAILATRAHENVFLAGGGFRPGRTEGTLQMMARKMLGKNPLTFGKILHEKIPSGGMMIIAGDFLQPIEDIETTLNALTRQSPHGIFIQVLDPAELTLPYAGRVKFEGMQEQFEETIDHVETVRTEYQRRIMAHTDTLRDLCHRKGWHYILHNTSQPARHAVEEIWTFLQHEGRGGRLSA